MQTTAHTNATEAQNTIAAIKAAAFGMNVPLNAGQLNRIAALEAQIKEA